MKPGDLLRLRVLGADNVHAYNLQGVAKEHGYLWVFVEGEVGHGRVLPDWIVWRAKSLATGAEEVFYHWRLERVEDAGER